MVAPERREGPSGESPTSPAPLPLHRRRRRYRHRPATRQGLVAAKVRVATMGKPPVRARLREIIRNNHAGAVAVGRKSRRGNPQLRHDGEIPAGPSEGGDRRPTYWNACVVSSERGIIVWSMIGASGGSSARRPGTSACSGLGRIMIRSVGQRATCRGFLDDDVARQRPALHHRQVGGWLQIQHVKRPWWHC